MIRETDVEIELSEPTSEHLPDVDAVWDQESLDCIDVNGAWRISPCKTHKRCLPLRSYCFRGSTRPH